MEQSFQRRQSQPGWHRLHAQLGVIAALCLRAHSTFPQTPADTQGREPLASTDICQRVKESICSSVSTLSYRAQGGRNGGKKEKEIQRLRTSEDVQSPSPFHFRTQHLGESLFVLVYQQ